MANPFIFNSVTLIKTKNSPTFKDYLECLKSYWSGKNVETVDKIGDVLAENVNHPFKFNLYNLWINCLERMGDNASLGALENHLKDRTDECEQNDKESLIWKCMLSLCIYAKGTEIEHTDSCTEISPSASQHEILLHYLRLAKIGKDQSPEILESAVSRIDDYFYIESLARNYYINEKHQDLLIVLNYASNLFEGSILEHEFKLHIAYDSKNFNAAWQYANQLVYRHPTNSDFWYYKGIIAAQLNRHDESQVCLEKSRDLMPNYLLQEKRLMNMTLLSTNESQDQQKENHCWMVNLTVKQRYEFMDSSCKTGTTWKMIINKKAQAGDLCFVTFSSAKDQLKLLGVFEITGPQEWHPMYGYFNNLTLKAKLVPTISMATESLDPQILQTDNQETRVFSLDGEALDIIIQELQMHEDETLISQLSKIEHKVDKMRMSS